MCVCVCAHVCVCVCTHVCVCVCVCERVYNVHVIPEFKAIIFSLLRGKPVYEDDISTQRTEEHWG